MIGSTSRKRMRNVLPNTDGIYDVFPVLNQSLFIEESRFPQNSQITILVGCVLAIAFLFWASIPSIEERTHLTGHIISSNKIKSIQHIEGGIIDEIKVRDGEFVREGQALLTLEGKDILTELKQAFFTETSLRIRAERLRAFALEQYPDFDAFIPEHQNFVTDQLLIYEMQIKNWEFQKNAIEKQQEQQKALLAIQLGQEKSLRERLGAKNTLRIRNELDQLLIQIHKTRHSIAEFDHKLSALGTQLRNDAIREMNSVAAEIIQVKESIAELQNRLNCLEIKAPVSGIIKGLKATLLKGVVPSGAEIMQILPEDAWEVEAQINPQEMRNLKVGQHVTLKISVFDDSRYGRIEGQVKSLSSLPFLDHLKKPYFKAYIAFKSPYLENTYHAHKLTIGMKVQVDIQGEKKSLIQYLIQPLYNSFKKPLQLR